MIGQRGVLVICAVGILFGIGKYWSERPIEHPPGVLIETVPDQREPRSSEVIEHGDYRLTPLAEFDLDARVLSREDYRFDEGSDLSPVDFALGWGRMSDTAVIDQLDISQSVRFFSYRWTREPPIPAAEIARSSANMHLIPANSSVERSLDRVRPGALIHLSGQLVEARRADGFIWRSSLTRNDTGGGACELVLVEFVETLAGP